MHLTLRALEERRDQNGMHRATQRRKGISIALVRRVKRGRGSGDSMARWRRTEQSDEQNVSREFDVFSEEVASTAPHYPAVEEIASPRNADERRGEIRGPLRDGHRIPG